MTFAEYLREKWITIVNDTILHFDVTLGAVAIAVVIGVGLGMLTYRHSTLAALATTTTGVFLTIPSVALLGVAGALVTLTGLAARLAVRWAEAHRHVQTAAGGP